MNRTPVVVAAVVTLMMFSGAGSVAENAPSSVEERVARAERGFARTMAERDHAAFVGFLSEEAVFLAGPEILRGKEAIAGHWKALFEGADAPFSWEPETVVALESGELALSTGPVRDPDGAQIAIFTSIWKEERPGVWRIVFDRGTRHCE